MLAKFARGFTCSQTRTPRYIQTKNRRPQYLQGPKLTMKNKKEKQHQEEVEVKHEEEEEEVDENEQNDDMEVGDEVEENGAEVYNATEPALNAIAQPLADKKLTKKLHKLLKKSAAQKNKLYRGLKNVQTRIRKGGTGLCILAGDVTPIDIYCHLPIVCEDKNIPYCFLPSKKQIAAAIGAKRPCIVALVSEDEDYKDLYDKCFSKLSKLSC